MGLALQNEGKVSLGRHSVTISTDLKGKTDIREMKPEYGSQGHNSPKTVLSVGAQ